MCYRSRQGCIDSVLHRQFHAKNVELHALARLGDVRGASIQHAGGCFVSPTAKCKRAAGGGSCARALGGGRGRGGRWAVDSLDRRRLCGLAGSCYYSLHVGQPAVAGDVGWGVGVARKN